MKLVFIAPTPPLPGGHDGGTRVARWVLEYLLARGHRINVIYLETPDLHGVAYDAARRERERAILKETGVTEISSIPIPGELLPPRVDPAPGRNLLDRLRRSIAYRWARFKSRAAYRAHVAREIKARTDAMDVDICFSFVEILEDIAIKPRQPLVSWMFQTGEPHLKLWIDFGFRKVLGSIRLAQLLHPLLLARQHRRLARTCINADHMIVPNFYYAELWRGIVKGRSKVHFIPHPAADESPELDVPDPCAPPRNRPYRIVMFGHLRAALTNAGLLHFTDEILPALDRRGAAADFEFQIVGQFEPFPFIAHKLARDGITLMGFVENFAQTLNRADAVLVPVPVAPGPGMRLCSASAVSACIVTHRATAAGSPEFIDGENCVMASSGDEFVDALYKVCQDEDLSRRLRAGARATYEGLYRMDDGGERVERILRDAAAAA